MELLTIVLSVIILPTILVVMMPLIDRILSDNVIETINNIVDYIEYLIGSTGTTLLFGTIGIILAMTFIRRFFSFFTGNNENK